MVLDQPSVMGILNITPDSFSDGGELYVDRKPALKAVRARAQLMIEAGAAILDVGGESTRPGAAEVSEQEELDRVIPVIETLAALSEKIVISIDSSKAGVMLAAASAGAGLINDVRALRQPAALQAAIQTGLPVVLMHMQGQPAIMQDRPLYPTGVINEVYDFLAARKACATAAGIDAANIILDPGIGFGKNLEHNLQLIARLGALRSLDCPILLSASRKSMLGHITGHRRPQERVAGSLAVALAGVRQGADIIRTHDVTATVDAIKTWQAIEQAQ